MKTLYLVPKIKIDGNLDLKNLSNLCKINLEKKVVSEVVVYFNYRKSKLSDIFNISIKSNDTKIKKVIIKKSNHHFENLGRKWSSGILKIFGEVGSFAGAEMSGGEIHISGSCLNYLGSKMIGGKIFISGNAKDNVGSSLFGEKIGMSGGFIYIKKNAGDYLGSHLRRGIICINGDIGSYGCSNMIAGSVLISGRFGNHFCLGMKRGTVLIRSDNKYFDNNQCFKDCGTQELNFFSFFKKELGDKTFFDSLKSMKFKKMVGDRSNFGLGEVLIVKK